MGGVLLHVDGRGRGEPLRPQRVVRRHGAVGVAQERLVLARALFDVTNGGVFWIVPSDRTDARSAVYCLLPPSPMIDWSIIATIIDASPRLRQSSGCGNPGLR
jgi:hypothetical protein